MTRQEAMTGVKPDISYYVPFYSTGNALVHKEERNNNLTYIAREVKMIGYADDLDELIYSNIQPINLELTQTILTTKQLCRSIN
jgi:hypothetical protein